MGDPAPGFPRTRGSTIGIFGAYDVRGNVETGDFTPDHARRIGAAFSRFAGGETVAVGRDCRASSPQIASAFIDGLTSAGSSVLDLGEVATEVVYYVSGSESVAGAMVTASHNPAQWNGIKFCLPGAAAVGADSGLEQIQRMAASDIPGSPLPGRITTPDYTTEYVEHMLSVIGPNQLADLAVVVDGGNGMASTVVQPVFSRLPVTLTGLYLTPDGSFPNHPPDPINPANLADLTAEVLRTGADLGVAFDGDADRAFFVDDRGQPMSGSAITTLICQWMLAAQPGATVVHNLICSRSVPEAIVAAGGVPFRSRVGHSFMKQAMADTGAIFGGEHSGHYYFAAHYGADSGMLATLVLFRLLSAEGRPLSQLHAEVTPYCASGEINLAVADHRDAIAQVAEAYSTVEQDLMDGLTVSWPNRWFNLRPSNTEPLLRLNAEGPDRSSVDQLVQQVQGLVDP